MKAGDQDVWDHLEALHSGDLALGVFEQWLYASTEAETVLGADEWLELVERDYRKRLAYHDTCRQIERIYTERRPGQLLLDRARRVATEFLENRRDLWSTSQALANLRREGCGLITLEFVGIDSELDDIPNPTIWGERAGYLLKKNEARLKRAHLDARKAAQEMLDALSTKPLQRT